MSTSIRGCQANVHTSSPQYYFKVCSLELVSVGLLF